MSPISLSWCRPKVGTLILAAKNIDLAEFLRTRGFTHDPNKIFLLIILDRPGRIFHVLLLYGVNGIIRSQIQFIELVHIGPNPQSRIDITSQNDVTHAGTVLN